jgi:hypothetical protein
MSVPDLEVYASNLRGDTWVIFALGGDQSFGYHEDAKGRFQINFRLLRGAPDEEDSSQMPSAPPSPLPPQTIGSTEIDCKSPSQQLEIGFCYYKAMDDTPYSVDITKKYEKQIDLSSDYRLSWKLRHSGGKPNCRVHLDEAKGYELCDTIDFAIQSKTVGWIGLGFMNQGIHHGMKDTDIVWGRVYDNGTVNIVDAKALAINVPTPDEELPHCDACKYDLRDVSGREQDGITTLQFSRLLDTGDEVGDVAIGRMETKPIVFAYSRLGNDGEMYHGPSRGFANVQFWEDFPDCKIENGDFDVSVTASCTDGVRLVTMGHVLPLELRQCVGNPPFETYELDCLYVGPNTSSGAICTIFGFISLAVSTVCLAWVVKNYSLPIVKMSQRQFCVAICVGAVLLSSSILLRLGTQERTFTDCQLPLWLFHVGFDLMFIPLFLKVNRTYQILQNKALKTKKITNKQLTQKIVLLISVDIILLLLWQITNVYEPKDVYESIPGIGVETPTPARICKSDDTVFALLVSCYKGVLMVAGCYYSYQAINVSDIFAEAKPIMACLYLIGCQSVMVLLLTYGIEGISASGQLLIQSIAVSIGIISVLMGLFVPKKLKYGHITTDKELWDMNRAKAEADGRGHKINVSPAVTSDTTTSSDVMPIAAVPKNAEQLWKYLAKIVESPDQYKLNTKILKKIEEIVADLESDVI